MEEFRTAFVGGRRLRYTTFGTGSPAVVLEQGAGISVETGFPKVNWIGWGRVFPEISKHARVLVYDRAGLGQSDPPPKVRTADTAARDLHAVLSQAKVAPPYVLVGHSAGGFIVRMYAHLYPNEVAGVVLVESSHPDQSSRFLAVLPSPSASESPLLMRLRREQSKDSSMERLDLAASAAEVRAAAGLGSKPLAVVTRSPDAILYRGVAPALAKQLEDSWQELQVDLLKQSTQSTHWIATAAGHDIQAEEPDIVIRAIMSVLHRAKGGETDQ
jgi:pimeloyl-ACP methyl ester carboxylesterase